MKRLSVLFVLILFSNAHADIREQVIEYKQGGATLEGFLVYDDAVSGKRPGVIVVHDWMGFGDYGNQRARELAEMGYLALAVDIYGKGVRPKDNNEAAAQSAAYKKDRNLMRSRVLAGLNTLKGHPYTDISKTAAIGYCFGGTVVLELARSGAVTNGVVSFHGGLSTRLPAHPGEIKAKVLVLHGADDPYVPLQEVTAFQNEMNYANADWQMVYYSDAVHSFTKKSSGDDKSDGVAYNANADMRSWKHMQQFFEEIF